MLSPFSLFSPRFAAIIFIFIIIFIVLIAAIISSALIIDIAAIFAAMPAIDAAQRRRDAAIALPPRHFHYFHFHAISLFLSFHFSLR
jgi:hypothetical protein